MHTFDRMDYKIISSLTPVNSRILDLGCGNGTLLKLLIEKNRVTGFGVDLDEDNIIDCVSKGLSVHHGDLESVLEEYPDKSFDYVILSLTLQAVKNPHPVIKQMLRVGSKAIVTFPNFAYLPIRTQLALRGRMPKTRELPYEWYNTPNIHLTTVKDFIGYCKNNQIEIKKAFYLSNKKAVRFLPNVRAYEALYVIEQ
jgi:methionine biosynthesis protein MetW